MPNHLEDIKCQQAEEGEKKSFAIFNGSFIALNVCCCCSFFLQLEKKYSDSEIVLFITLSFAPFIDGWWAEFFEIISKQDSLFFLTHPCHPNFSSVVITTQGSCLQT